MTDRRNGAEAIRLVDRGQGIHGAIVDDVLHLGGETTPAECRALSAARTLTGDDHAPAAQTQEAPDYFLLVVKYETGNRLYVVRTQADGTACIVDTHDRCIVQVTVLPDGFDLSDLPADVPPTMPAGQPEAPAEPEPEPPPAPASIPTVAGTYEGEADTVRLTSPGGTVYTVSSRWRWVVKQDEKRVTAEGVSSGSISPDFPDPSYISSLLETSNTRLSCDLTPSGRCIIPHLPDDYVTFTGNELRFGYLLSDNLCSRYPATNPCHIDRIESLAYALPKVASAPPPAPAAPAAPASPVSNISPADGATNVATSRFITPYTNTTLAWTWNGGPWLFKLCISTSSRALNASNCQQLRWSRKTGQVVKVYSRP